MEITHLGHSCFKLKGKNACLVTDPFDPGVLSLAFPKTEADIVTVSHLHSDHNYIETVNGTPVIVSGAGEYEIKGVNIIGVSTYHDKVKGQERGKNIIYRIEMDKMSFVHCGDLGHKLEDKEIEILTGCDVLMIPTGGFYTINAADACEVISQLEPKIIIPMHYKTTGLNPEIADKLSEVGVFLKEMGKDNITPLPKLNITFDKIALEPTIVVLE